MDQMRLLETSPDDLEAANARSLLDQLLDESRLYRTGKEYQALLDFVVRLRNFAPFNAMLLQVQKPGLLYAASRVDWLTRFNRTVKYQARPLLILWPFAPVALVYDVADTEGDPLPDGVSAFAATGTINQTALDRFAQLLGKKHIAWNKVDAGEGRAGSIQRVHRPAKPSEPSIYRMAVNKNHNPNVQFSTLAHELAHLFLGHLGRDVCLRIPDRSGLKHEQCELEAESTAFLVCARNGVECKSQSYLSGYVKQDTSTQQLDFYQIMRAAGQVETLLDLAAHTNVERSKKSDTETMALFP